MLAIRDLMREVGGKLQRRAQAAANSFGSRGSPRGPGNAQTCGPMVANNAAFG